MRDEVRQYLTPRVKTPLTGERRDAALRAIDYYVKVRFTEPDSYLDFRNHFDSLRWQLWTATERPTLTAEQRTERDRQRQWMFDYLRGFPAVASSTETAEQQQAGWPLSLKHGVFAHPLIPVFHDPMSAEEFADFQQQLEHLESQPKDPVWRVFYTALAVREETIFARWPLDLGPAASFPFWRRRQGWQFLFLQFFRRPHEPSALDCSVAAGTDASIFRPGQAQGGHTACALRPSFDRRWLAEQEQGSIWFDAQTRRLLPVRQTKMALLEQTGWHTADRFSLADLRKLLRESPVESLTVPKLDGLGPDESRRVAAATPSLVLENNEGTIAVARIQPHEQPGTFVIHFCYRPQGAYPPFHAADPEYVEDDLNYFQVSPSLVAKQHAPPVTPTPPDVDLIDVVADRFKGALERLRLPYLEPKHLAAARAEMRHYLKLRVKMPQIGVSRPDLLLAIDAFVARKFAGDDSYLGFRVNFDMLSWRLWTALDRVNLTPEAMAEHKRQRDWMRTYIRERPEPELTRKNWRQSRQAQLERLENETLVDPLSPFFHDPMSPEEFAALKKQLPAAAQLALADVPNLLFRRRRRCERPGSSCGGPPAFRPAS